MKLTNGKTKIASMCMAFAMLALGVTGCSTSGTGSSDSAASNSGTSSASSTSSSQEDTSSDSENVLRVARTYDASCKSMDPARWSGGDDMMCGPSVYETLLDYDSDLNIVGRLAESYEYTEDDLSFTFHLREGVQFHHGYGEMTSEDVKFTIERLADPELNATTKYTNIAYENIASIETPDTYTVVINLNNPDIYFLDKMCESYAYIISEKAVEDMGIDGFSKLGVGTGPFEICEGGVLGEKYEVVRFDDYWGEKAKLDKIIFYTISDDTTLTNAFEAGEIDVFDCSDVDLLLKYKADDKYTVIDSPDKSLLYLGMNMQCEPLNDPLVREAISYAIDRDMLVSDYFQGFEQKATGMLPLFTKYSVQDYWNPQYDPEKAKELLAEAGYPDGFSIDLYTVNDTLSLGPATLFQYFLSQVGIDVNFQAVEIGVFLDKVREGEAPMWSFWNSTNIIPDSTLTRYLSSEYPGSNWCGFLNEDYDAAVEKAIAETDSDKKAEYYAEAQKLLMDSNSLYTATTYTCHTCTQAYVKGFARNALLRMTWEQMYIER